MYKTLIIDFSRVLLFSYEDVASLNKHHETLSSSRERYRILDHFYLNDELLSFVGRLKGQLKICLFTDGNLHDVPDIRRQVAAAFDEVVTAEDIGSQKSDPQTYRRLARQLNARPEETLFVDDKPANVEAALAAGLTAVRFEGNSQIVAELSALLGR